MDSLLNKRNELDVLITKHKPTIIALTEIMPKNCKNVIPSEFDLYNYDKFVNDIKQRGVILYVHKEVKATEVTVDENGDFDEYIMCEVKTNTPGVTLLLTCIYRSPNSSEDNNAKLIKLLAVIDKHPAKLKCTVGDFNLPGINWESGETRDYYSKAFYECTLDLFMHQNVTNTTRNKIGQNPSLLDLIFTNDENLVSEIKHNAPLGKSDHDIIVFTLNLHIQDHTSPEVLLYNKGNYEQFGSFIDDYDWSPMQEANVEDSWSIIKQVLSDGVDLYIPKSKLKSKQNHKPLWLNNEATIAVKEKNRAYKKYLLNRTHYNEFRYKTKRNTATNEVRKAKKRFEHKLAKECTINPKAFWKYIKSKTVSKENIGILQYNGITAESDIEKAELLNSFFADVYTDEDIADMPNIDISSNESFICEIRVTPESVRDKLNKLNPNKSVGPDRIHPRILKELASHLATPISCLLNKCFECGRIPNDWKNSDVICIFKKGDKSDPGNYRPVSLTCILSKIAESFMKEYIYNFLESNKYLCDEQHGFRSHRSCTTQLLLVSDIISKRIEDGLDTDVIYLDFQKAFDKVPHRRLLLKLAAAGIKGSALGFITDFLHNRKCRIKVNGSFSTKSSVKSGIPQGSVIGPLLFIIFINDLPIGMHNYCMMFADDTKIFGAPGPVLQLDVDKASEWACKWQMNFNINKCKVLHFTMQEDLAYEYRMPDNNTICTITATNKEKDIGVIFDNNLLFNSHITATVNKCQGILSVIKRTFTFLDENILTLLYVALIRPIVEYSNVIWTPHLKKHINMIGGIQRRATRMIPTLSNLSYPERLDKLNLFSLSYRRRRGDLIQVYKIMHSIDNIRYQDLFEINRSITRGHEYKIHKQFCRTNSRKFTFSQRLELAPVLSSAL